MDFFNKRKKGKIGEEKAVKFLRRKGFTIVETNFSCKIGEIDIIAKKNKSLYFVEVKYRENADFGTPLEAINSKKQEKIIKTSQFYCISKNISDSPIFYSAIGISEANGEEKISFVENIFY